MNLQTNANAHSLKFLGGETLRLASHGPAANYAIKILGDLGAPDVASGDVLEAHPAIAWAESGLMWLTGHAGADPLMCPAPVASCADGVLKAITALRGGEALEGTAAAELLCGRAAFLNLSRNGPVSANGHCRLLQAVDGWIAVNLARASDWDLLPAWLQEECSPMDWQAIVVRVADHKVDALIAQASLLGLPVAEVAQPQKRPWVNAVQTGHKSKRCASASPLVVDLSALWAGPLTSHLLERLGARIIKVEDQHRPDGARDGNANFYTGLNAGKECVALDLKSNAGVRALKRLIAKADIVIEGSRPRALKQLGIDAASLVARKPGLIWISITGYGRGTQDQNRVAFGDDASVAGGLVWLMDQSCAERVFCGDAIADPLTGLHAALAAWAGWLSGEAALLDVSLRNVVAHVCSFETPSSARALAQRVSDWRTVLCKACIHPSPPTVEVPKGTASQLGAHNDRLSAEFDFAC